jgi:DNA invertase Pin-like site-specific DNA recombinase
MGNLKHELGFWFEHIPNDSHIFIYSVDRLSRHMLKGLDFLEKAVLRNISVHFVTNGIVYNKDISAGNKAMVQSELQSAEKYSNLTSEKIKGTLRRLKTEGHSFGKAPYGFKNVIINGIRKRVVDDRESDNIRKIKTEYNYIHEHFDEIRVNERMRRNYSSIYRHLIRWCNRSGIKNRNGDVFRLSQIKTIVNSD